MHINKKILFAALLASQLWFLGVSAMGLPAPRDSNSDNASRSPECECSKCENPVSLSPERREAMKKAFSSIARICRSNEARRGCENNIAVS